MCCRDEVAKARLRCCFPGGGEVCRVKHQTLLLKEKLLKASNFSFCNNVFNFFQSLYTPIYSDFPYFCLYVSRLLHICCMWERVNKTVFTCTFVRLVCRLLGSMVLWWCCFAEGISRTVRFDRFWIVKITYKGLLID